MKFSQDNWSGVDKWQHMLIGFVISFVIFLACFLGLQTLKIIEIQAEQRVATATGEANSVMVVAAAKANATLVNAQAEAKAVQLISEQLNNQPKYVEYIKAQRWDGQLPKISGGVTPFLETNFSI